jgi:site-specific DNA-methyltransferase (adenine-specific)
MGSISDVILWYTKGPDYQWVQPFKTLTPEENEKKFKNVNPNGRRWQSVSLRNPSVRPNLQFEYTASNGFTYKPHPNGWVCNLDVEKRLHFPTSEVERFV